MRISDWSSDVCSSDLSRRLARLDSCTGYFAGRPRRGGTLAETALDSGATGGNASRISDAQRQQVTDKKEEYYQPWLRDPAPTPGAPRTDEGDEGLAKPKETPPVGLDLSRYPAADEPKRPPLVETDRLRSEEHTSELQSLMRPSYAVFRLKK